MAANANVITQRPVRNAASPRLADRRLFLIAALGFPLLILIGYARTYYLAPLFDAKPLANQLVHFHAITMSAWVLYFTAQVLLIRTRNVRLHMTMGLVGVALAALVIVVGMATAYDAQLVRHAAPPGQDPRAFFLIPVFDMLQFLIYFSAAIYYRKRPAEHKTLMLLTALNFLPAALFRIPAVAPENTLLWAFGTPALMALVVLAWHSVKHGKINRVFAAGIALMIVTVPFRIWFGGTGVWLAFADWLAK